MATLIHTIEINEKNARKKTSRRVSSGRRYVACVVATATAETVAAHERSRAYWKAALGRLETELAEAVKRANITPEAAASVPFFSRLPDEEKVCRLASDVRSAKDSLRYCTTTKVEAGDQHVRSWHLTEAAARKELASARSKGHHFTYDVRTDVHVRERATRAKTAAQGE